MINKLNLRKRADIILKYLFAQEIYLSNFSDFFQSRNIYKEFYKNHIYLRNSYKEAPSKYGNSNKKTFKDFNNAFLKIILSMKSKGYKKEHPIYVCNQNILNGAHRYAASLALNIEPYLKIVDDDKIHEWDLEWFKNFNFPKEIINTIVKETLYINPDKFRVIIPWSENIYYTSNQFLKELEKENIKIFHTINIKLNKLDLLNFVRLIYVSGNHDLAPTNAVEKVELIKKKDSINFYIVDEFDNKNDRKKMIREKLISKNIKNKNKLFSAFHMTDSGEESSRLVDLIVMSIHEEIPFENRINKIRAEYISNYLKEYQNNRKLANKVIVGSFSLYCLNIRKHTDIDLLSSNRKRLTKEDTEFFDLVSYNFFSDKKSSLNFLTDTDLCNFTYLHDRILGMKILKPSIVIKRKEIDQRPKDIKDIKAYSIFKKIKYKNYSFNLIKSNILYILLSKFYPKLRPYIPNYLKKFLKKLIKEVFN